MYKYANQSPTISDVVVFELEITDEHGSLKDPFCIEKVTIYFLERDLGKNSKYYEEKLYNEELEKELKDLQNELRDNYSIELLKVIKSKKEILELTAVPQRVFYKEARHVMSTTSPLWIANDDNSKIKHVLDKDKAPIAGKFVFMWKPEGMREGNYIIKWDYKLHEKTRRKQSGEQLFILNPDTKNLTNIHARYTPRGKYEMLLDKYEPPMYKSKINSSDLTPEMLNALKKIIGEGFTVLEDYANQLIDILDANFTPSGVLPLLANMFGVTLRSDDVNLWRRQIKQAIPLFKTKGTIEGLTNALSQAGIKLHKLTRLWQVTSLSQWTDGFLIQKDKFSNDWDGEIGKLTKKPISEDFKVELRSGGEKNYITLPIDSVILLDNPEENIVSVIWNNSDLDIIEGDYLRITYKYDEGNPEIENYIFDLPLADQRDEIICGYPLKNWNVRLIEEDDTLFDVIISERHPFYNPVVYGKIRTTFLYSEKVYNMDTYNGSLRDSLNPCNMDKDFIDKCSCGQSSKFNVYLEVERLSDERILEAEQIIKEYSPFHAILHKMNINGRITEFMLPPVERIESDLKNESKSENKEVVEMKENISYEVRWKNGHNERGRIKL